MCGGLAQEKTSTELLLIIGSGMARRHFKRRPVVRDCSNLGICKEEVIEAGSLGTHSGNVWIHRLGNLRIGASAGLPNIIPELLGETGHRDGGILGACSPASLGCAVENNTEILSQTRQG